MEIRLRNLAGSDRADVGDLLVGVAAQRQWGLARAADEIGDAYVGATLDRCSGGGVAIGALNGDRLVGVILAERPEPRMLRHVLADTLIAVAPDHQGMGVGSMLIEALIDAARGLAPPVTRIELFCRSGHHGAIRLYERLGFRPEGRFVGRVRLPDGTVEDDIAMARAI